MEDGKLIISLEGRIDTNNAMDIEKELMGIIEEHKGEPFELNAADLEYISSAGLRVLLKLRKSTGAEVVIRDVSPAIYEIFDTTGFVDLLTVVKKLREIDVEGMEVIGQGGNGTIYRIDDDKIVKVYKPWMKYEDIDREREYARTAFVSGIPSVIAYDLVRCGDCLGVVFELLRSDTLGHAMMAHPEKLEEYVDKYVELAKLLHSTKVKDDSFERIQDVYRRRLSNLTEWCSEEEITLLGSLIDEIPESNTVTHNDLHPGNIMIQDGELVLIDMPEVTMGPPMCDLVSIYRDMIAAPSGEEKGSIEYSVGMPADKIIQVGNMFFMKYTGITDPDELKAYYDKLGLLFAFNVTLVVGSGSERSTALAPILMEKLLRGIVVPHEQVIRQLLKAM